MSKSFQLIRTNPSLTTNVKVVVSSSDRLYFESFDANNILSDIKYKHVSINKNSSYSSKLSDFYKDTQYNTVFSTVENQDPYITYKDYQYQFDDTYYAGAQNIEDQSYGEEFEYLAPLYIRSTLPTNFLILRVDDPAIYEERNNNYYLGSLNKDNFRREIVDKWKFVKMFDLTKVSSVGSFLEKNFTNNVSFPTAPLDFNYEDPYKYPNFYGIKLNQNVYTSLSSHLTDLKKNMPHHKFESLMTNNYANNSLVFPNIINLKFLFDDSPATPDRTRKYSINRYYGFYIDSLELVTNLTSYVGPVVNSAISYDIKNNIFIESGSFSKPVYTDPFVPGTWSSTLKNYIYVDGKLNLVTYTSSRYKMSDSLALDGKVVQNDYSVTIKYNSADKKSYITGKNLIIDPHISTSGISSMYSDLYLIKIHNLYHVLKCQQSGNTFVYYVHTDYAINSDSTGLEYWNANQSKTSVSITTSSGEPLSYPIFRVNFTDIKDFDFDRVNTRYSDFDYEKEVYHKTPEHKLYATEWRDTSQNKDFKIHDQFINGQYDVMNVSSEYISSEELFDITSGIPLWKKNQNIVKWGYQGSISHMDYPYKLNISNDVGSYYNKTTCNGNTIVSSTNKNLDYFYRIGKFVNSNNETERYYNQSTNIETDLMENNTDERFDLETYLKSDVDYFDYFFNNKMFSQRFGQLYQKQTKKYATFNLDHTESLALFKGLKLKLTGIDSITSYPNGTTIAKSNTKKFVNYKISIILNDRYNMYERWKFDNIEVTAPNTIKLTGSTGHHMLDMLSDFYVEQDVVTSGNTYDVNYNGLYKSTSSTDSGITISTTTKSWLLPTLKHPGYVYQSGTTVKSAIKGEHLLSNTGNSIHVIVNDVYKNVLVIINQNIPMPTQSISFNNTTEFDENFGLYSNLSKYNNKEVVPSNYITSTGGVPYVPNDITAFNVLNTLNNWSHSDSLVYYYVDSNAKSGSTTMMQWYKSTIKNTNFGKAYPPFLLTSYRPLMFPVYNAYTVIPIKGPATDISDDFSLSQSDRMPIDDYLARNIVDKDININDPNYIYRYDGKYEPIFKDIQIFNPYKYWYTYEYKTPLIETYSGITIKFSMTGNTTIDYTLFLVSGYTNQTLSSTFDYSVSGDSMLRCYSYKNNVNNIFVFTSKQDIYSFGDLIISGYTSGYTNMLPGETTTNYKISKKSNKLSRNYKFDTDLEKFGTIDEIMYSKVNPDLTFLKLSNTTEQSKYPMVDEIGLSCTSRFIFKSTWDKEYFIKTNNEIYKP